MLTGMILQMMLDWLDDRLHECRRKRKAAIRRARAVVEGLEHARTA